MSKDWTMNIGTFSKDWVMNVGAYSTSSGGGSSDDALPLIIFTDRGSWSTNHTYAEVKAVYDEFSVNDEIPVLVDSSGDVYWAYARFTTQLDWGAYEIPETVTEGFMFAGMVFGNDGNFYTGGK